MNIPSTSSDRRIGVVRFIAAEVALTLGALIAANFGTFGLLFGYWVMGFTGYIMVPAPLFRPVGEVFRSVGKNEIAGIALGVLVVCLLIFGVIRFIPEESVARWIQHPVWIATVWLIFCAIQFQQWRKSRAASPAQPQQA